MKFQHSPQLLSQPTIEWPYFRLMQRMQHAVYYTGQLGHYDGELEAQLEMQRFQRHAGSRGWEHLIAMWTMQMLETTITQRQVTEAISTQDTKLACNQYSLIRTVQELFNNKAF